MKTISFIFLACLLGACGKSVEPQFSDAPQVEVITDVTAYASVVRVILPNGAGLCTGTFISPRAVLTAAHCTQKNGLYKIYSGFGTFSTYDKVNLSTGQLEDPNDLSILILGSDAARRNNNQVAYIGSEARSGERIRIVGYGCNSLDTKLGSGQKRAGTNTIGWITDYLHLRTPFSSDSSSRRILGPKDEAGSCFGDSGGPMFRADSYENSLVGITHAGGKQATFIESQYLNLGRSEIQNFIHSVNTTYSLGIFDYCQAGDSIPGACGQQASLSFLESVRHHIIGFFTTLKTLVLSWFK